MRRKEMRCRRITLKTVPKMFRNLPLIFHITMTNFQPENTLRLPSAFSTLHTTPGNRSQEGLGLVLSDQNARSWALVTNKVSTFKSETCASNSITKLKSYVLAQAIAISVFVPVLMVYGIERKNIFPVQYP